MGTQPIPQLPTWSVPLPTASLETQVLARVPLPILAVDGVGEVVFVNDSAAEALGYAGPSSLRGRQGHETIHHRRPDGSAYPEEDCPLLRPSRSGRPSAAQDQSLIRRDGSLFPIAWSAAPIDLPGGRGTVLSFWAAPARRTGTSDQAPQGTAVPTAASARSILAERVKTFATANAADPAVTPQSLAQAHHMSLRALQALFADHGDSPASFLRQQRLVRAERLLLDGQSVAAATARSGFTDPGTFARAFRRRFGLPPSQYVKRHSSADDTARAFAKLEV